ncbi:MAG TPA: cytochrome c3 family protein [Candidatus Methylomirabilis sp.]|nr:cytochrome c3 family protein [Candidatus Methylomirabilis sp.]
MVTFSHEKQAAAGNKCMDYHSKVFKMKKGTSGDITMAKMKAGEQCGACHSDKKEVGGKTVFMADTLSDNSRTMRSEWHQDGRNYQAVSARGPKVDNLQVPNIG